MRDLKYKYQPGILEEGIFPYKFEILRNSEISTQYVYFSMFAYWNEIEFLKLREEGEFETRGKTVGQLQFKKLISNVERIKPQLIPLMLELTEKYKEKEDYLREKEIEVMVDDREVTMRMLKQGEWYYLPLSGDIFSRIFPRDKTFCSYFHISRSSLSHARKKLKELNLIDYNSKIILGEKMTYFQFIPPIKEWMAIPMKIFYVKDLSLSSKVILFWINKYLKEIDIKKLNRKSFIEFSGFRDEKTLRKIRNELIPIFPSAKELLQDIL